MNKMKCIDCGAADVTLFRFVDVINYEDGRAEKIEGNRTYCDPCRGRAGISSELNPGRDLRAEARQATLDAVVEARATFAANKGKGLDVIMQIDDWVGSTDQLFGMLGRRIPRRPQEVFDGVSDAMGKIDPATMTISQALALITVTNTVSDRIENWGDFVQRTYEHLKKIEPGRADKIMVGFI